MLAVRAAACHRLEGASDPDHEPIREAVGCQRRRYAAPAPFSRGADLLALAVHTPVAFGRLSTGSACSHRSANDALCAALVEQLSDAVAALGGLSEISGRVLEGDAASELAGASADLDLLVLGSRGYGPVRSVLLGSVSRALVRSAACPVVVLPRSDRGVESEAPTE